MQLTVNPLRDIELIFYGGQYDNGEKISMHASTSVKLNEIENFAVEMEIHDVSADGFEVMQVCARTCCSQEREEVNMESNRHEEHGTFGT
jgi:mevalonate pyrophosphate decarboxylase